jgi:hypothetical protein
MKLFEGKSPEERNKLIAAIVIGALAVVALTWGIILPMFSSKKTSVKVDVNASPTPTAVASATPVNAPVAPLPNQQEIDFAYTTTPVVYGIGGFGASPPGRNIFAFYEPPKPTPYVAPPPKPSKTPTPLPPPPDPDFFIAYLTPQSVYAGTKGFRLEVNGDKFTEDVVILANGTQLPTKFITPQGLSAQISDNMIANPGSIQISVIVPGSPKFSNMGTINVQKPPTPQFEYIGMISRKRNNNDTAYFQEKGNEKDPISARLNDVVGGRFRLKSISVEEVILEDVNLGFRHKLALYRPEPGQDSGAGNRGSVAPYNPNDRRRNTTVQPQSIPGIPDNIPRYKPTPQPTEEPDVNDDDQKGDDN